MAALVGGGRDGGLGTGFLLLEVRGAEVLRTLVSWARAATDLAPLSAAVGPAKAMGDRNRPAVRVRASRSATVGPAHSARLRAVNAVLHLALDAAAVAPALPSVLGSARASLDDAVLALGTAATRRSIDAPTLVLEAVRAIKWIIVQRVGVAAHARLRACTLQRKHMCVLRRLREDKRERALVATRTQRRAHVGDTRREAARKRRQALRGALVRMVVKVAARLLVVELLLVVVVVVVVLVLLRWQGHPQRRQPWHLHRGGVGFLVEPQLRKHSGSLIRSGSFVKVGKSKNDTNQRPGRSFSLSIRAARRILKPSEPHHLIHAQPVATLHLGASGRETRAAHPTFLPSYSNRV
jgi:hypothetical protein